DLVDVYERASTRTHSIDDGWQRTEGGDGPGVEEHRRCVGWIGAGACVDPSERIPRDSLRRALRIPVVEDQVLADILVPEPTQDAQDARIAAAGREGAAEPW